MEENPTPKPEEILSDLLKDLQSENASERSSAIGRLTTLNYSSEAVRNELEKLAVGDIDESIRREALAALGLPAQRNVRRHFNKMDRSQRQVILREIEEWEKLGLLENPNADLLRRRYDFDFAPALKVDSSQIEVEARDSLQPAPEPVPAGPRPTLTQTLLSESNIKISLYLGAFFVVASAAILGAFVDVFRIPLLILGTIFFGGTSVAIRKRLPQPSFALFIVFSFFLPITANVVENTLELSGPINAVYWVIVGLFMTAIWGGGTWLYSSRLFSLTAFAALVTAFYRVGDIFGAEPDFSAAMLGLAALAGLAGVWGLKKWQDAKFTLPLFLAAQVLQFGLLVTYQGMFMFGTGDFYASELWKLLLALTWGLAFPFYVFSNLLYPFFLFPWLAAGTLIFIPWLTGAAFEAGDLANTILFGIWGLVLSAVSEVINKFTSTQKYSLPILLGSIPVLTVAIVSGFNHIETLGFVAAFFITLIYGVLHFFRPRGWLWALALLSFTVAYVAFFNLPFTDKIQDFIGYQQLGLVLTFLTLELLLKKAGRAWTLPPKVYGGLFTAFTSITFIIEEAEYAAIGFAIFTLFFVIYTAVQRKAFYGYLPAAFLALTAFFTLDYFNLDLWLPALTGLAVIYFVVGVLVRSKEELGWMLRTSGLTLGVIAVLSALVIVKETGGWYALVIGLLFAAEMTLSRNGWFEVGLPILFTIGTFLIFHDLDLNKLPHHLLTYSLVWFVPDIVGQLTFKHPRPLKWVVRGVGALLAVVNYGVLFFDESAATATLGFGVYSLLFLTISLVYRQPTLLYAFTLTLPIFVTFAFRNFDITKWIHPVIFVAMGYYAAGFVLRLLKRAAGWDSTLLFSGLGLGVIVSMAAPVLGGLDAAIPVAFAATLWAVEAFWRRNVWLGFPANSLYLLAYFIILNELNVDQPQFYSMGAALLGMVQHYLLTRAGSKTGTFIMGMLSQLTLLGTTYIQMVSNGSEGLIYFVVLFLQSLAVLVYGVVIRSRSLTFTPILFSVVGVLSVLYIVVYDLLDAFTTILMVGCTGIILIGFGILAVLMRERITKFGEKLSEWKA
ncbi:hypothetical protein ANAEL_03888 [Anaerolineales bacterium]|nr:hypothetical protein ANAEL_03888 [Anaerolineales bacterium]